MIHTQREKRKRLKIIIIKKEIEIFVPCCDPPQMEKGLTLNTKISQFLYIKLPLLALVQELHSFLSRASSAERISISNLLVFTVFFFTDYHFLQFQIVQRKSANMTCSGRFSASFILSFFFFFSDEPPLFFFSFFFTLQNYNSIHIFSSLNSCF